MRVFVSSTYKDLVDHRRAAADALERLGLQLDRMETFGARPQDPTQACLGEIDASELFVGIYAHRYGFIPADSTTSITEAEFDYAFNNRRPTFCFLIDEKYPWPKELVESEPGRSLLIKFKTRLEKLVVRDFFTTPDVLASRIASSIGRYLIVDPRRHESRSAAEFARLTLADVATMAFVDVMRLACVAGSNAARNANKSRYAEFVDIADMHLSDFRIQVTRLATDSDIDIITKCSEVERGLVWAIVRLRRTPKLDRSWSELIGELRGLAERVHALAESVSLAYYVSRIRDVLSTAQASIRNVSSRKLISSPDTFVGFRFETQSIVLEQMEKSEGLAIATIRDDIDRALGIPYFTIDLALLRKATEK